MADVVHCKVANSINSPDLPIHQIVQFIKGPSFLERNTLKSGGSYCQYSVPDTVLVRMHFTILKLRKSRSLYSCVQRLEFPKPVQLLASLGA